MPDVRMPDGTIIRNVPEGTTKAELLRRVQAQNPAGFNVPAAERAAPFFEAQAIGAQAARQTGAVREPSFSEAFGRSAASRFLNNILGIPDVAATAGTRMLLGQPLVDRDIQGVDPRLNQRLANLPRVGERVLPLPSGAEVVAGAETAAQIPSALMSGEPLALGDRFAAQQDEAARVAMQRPGATRAGEVTGDIATLLSGRMGIGGGARRAARSATPNLPAVRKAPLPPGLRRELDDITKKVVASNLPRGLRRAAETGLEGAVLAVLDEGDPLQTAAFSAGAQAGGSLFLTMAKPLVTSKSGLLSTIALGTVGLQLFKEATPGGQDRILESVETSIFKVLPTVTLGVLSAAAGFGRTSGRFRENLPKIADAITTIPRGAVVSLLKDLAKDAEGDGTTARVLEKFTEDPTYFGPGAMVRLQRALRGEKVSLTDEVNRMMRSREFRRLVDELE